MIVQAGPFYEVREILLDFGRGPYESGVTHLEHALQTAHLAELGRARPDLIFAALVHDIGHLLLLRDKSIMNAVLGKHEEVAADWLVSRFPSHVADIVKLHVDAKRYLSAIDPGFVKTLSTDSRMSLRLQGGAFTMLETELFLKKQHAQDSIRLRNWDDAAKRPGYATCDIDHFLSIARSM